MRKLCFFWACFWVYLKWQNDAECSMLWLQLLRYLHILLDVMKSYQNRNIYTTEIYILYRLKRADSEYTIRLKWTIRYCNKTIGKSCVVSVLLLLDGVIFTLSPTNDADVLICQWTRINNSYWWLKNTMRHDDATEVCSASKIKRWGWRKTARQSVKALRKRRASPVWGGGVWQLLYYVHY